MKKNFLVLVSALLLTGVLAACGGSNGQGQAETTAAGGSAAETVPAAETEKTQEAVAAADFKVGIIFTEAGLGGQSFNDLAYEGVKRAADELGIQFDAVEPKSVSDEEIVQDEMAASGEYGIIICVGSEQVDALTKVAPNYPDQKFALIDAVLELDNVACFTSKEQEGSFLAGALAVLVKQEQVSDLAGDNKTIGVMCGVDNALLNKFSAGYKAGAMYIDPEYNVLIDYVGGFSDPTTAKNIATTFHDKGADVIFHAAGASGMGMFQAAEEQGFMAIGVNLNQNNVAPDYIVASMMKRVDSSAYYAIESAMNGTFEPGVKVMGVADEGVGLDMSGSNIELPASVTDQLEEIKAKIASGELVVPETLGEVDAFLADQS